MQQQNGFNRKNDRFWTGFVLILAGGVLLINKLGVPLPYWLFTWPMILILVGLVSGLKHGFSNSSWLIILGIGCIFLADEIVENMNLRNYFWPIALMGFGLVFMLRPKNRLRYERWGLNDETTDNTEQGSVNTEEVLNCSSIFGGVKKTITSKNFNGGYINCFMGGTEVNLSQADINKPVTIEIMQAFGGTKLIVPPHWEIRSEAVAIFGGFDDKRPVQPGRFDPTKILVLKGTTLFGGIEIKSY